MNLNLKHYSGHAISQRARPKVGIKREAYLAPRSLLPRTHTCIVLLSLEARLLSSTASAQSTRGKQACSSRSCACPRSSHCNAPLEASPLLAHRPQAPRFAVARMHHGVWHTATQTPNVHDDSSSVPWFRRETIGTIRQAASQPRDCEYSDESRCERTSSALGASLALAEDPYLLVPCVTRSLPQRSGTQHSACTPCGRSQAQAERGPGAARPVTQLRRRVGTGTAPIVHGTRELHRAAVGLVAGLQACEIVPQPLVAKSGEVAKALQGTHLELQWVGNLPGASTLRRCGRVDDSCAYAVAGLAAALLRSAAAECSKHKGAQVADLPGCAGLAQLHLHGCPTARLARGVPQQPERGEAQLCGGKSEPAQPRCAAAAAHVQVQHRHEPEHQVLEALPAHAASARGGMGPLLVVSTEWCAHGSSGACSLSHGGWGVPAAVVLRVRAMALSLPALARGASNRRLPTAAGPADASHRGPHSHVLPGSLEHTAGACAGTANSASVVSLGGCTQSAQHCEARPLCAKVVVRALVGPKPWSVSYESAARLLPEQHRVEQAHGALRMSTPGRPLLCIHASRHSSLGRALVSTLCMTGAGGVVASLVARQPGGRCCWRELGALACGSALDGGFMRELAVRRPSALLSLCRSSTVPHTAIWPALPPGATLLEAESSRAVAVHRWRSERSAGGVVPARAGLLAGPRRAPWNLTQRACHAAAAAAASQRGAAAAQSSFGATTCEPQHFRWAVSTQALTGPQHSALQRRWRCDGVSRAGGMRVLRWPVRNIGSRFLLTGGLGALGLLSACWLLDSATASGVELLGRSGRTRLAARLTSHHAPVVTRRADVSLRAHAACERQCTPCSAAAERGRGVLHAGGVLLDAALARQSCARFSAVMAPKVAGLQAVVPGSAQGAWHCQVVVFSSITAALGTPGQANYGAANGVLDSAAVLLSHEGCQAASVQWGAWATGGMAQQSARVLRSALSQGTGVVTPESGARVLELVLRNDPVSPHAPVAGWARGAGAASTEVVLLASPITRLPAPGCASSCPVELACTARREAGPSEAPAAKLHDVRPRPLQEWGLDKRARRVLRRARRELPGVGRRATAGLGEKSRAEEQSKGRDWLEEVVQLVSRTVGRAV
eukprot:CAMPEP_0183819730 /NCGR_PEP_ID=MMETSP0803_2-20130417/64289_1 /TAXON_ID=195967 /ORGANISM="Crustomastix stigmata, Strain CCMP3273" /LENGTH=1128 /DNA_ID=CAMNT_0026064619 /DNA_START=2633 /DNA_END=6016 /DNA_ORIENTATION=-